MLWERLICYDRSNCQFMAVRRNHFLTDDTLIIIHVEISTMFDIKMNSVLVFCSLFVVLFLHPSMSDLESHGHSHGPPPCTGDRKQMMPTFMTQTPNFNTIFFSLGIPVLLWGMHGRICPMWREKRLHWWIFGRIGLHMRQHGVSLCFWSLHSTWSNSYIQ